MKKIAKQSHSISLSIGIPAYNEEKNIKNLLNSVLSQKQQGFHLESVWVICDCCTDKTASIATELANKYPFIKVFEQTQRAGKAGGLNFIYKMNESDLLMTLDADVVLGHKRVIAEMVKEMMLHKETNVVSGFLQPLKAHTIMERIGNALYLMWREIKMGVNDGHNIHNLDGASVLIKRKFAAKISFPLGLIADQGYLYVKSTLRTPKGFRLAKTAPIIFRPVSTWNDMRVQSKRAIYTDKDNLAQHLGYWTRFLYVVPIRQKILGLLKSWLSNPFFVSAAIIISILVRLFPYDEKAQKTGLWDIVTSTKKAINI